MELKEAINALAKLRADERQLQAPILSPFHANAVDTLLEYFERQAKVAERGELNEETVLNIIADIMPTYPDIGYDTCEEVAMKAVVRGADWQLKKVWNDIHNLKPNYDVVMTTTFQHSFTGHIDDDGYIWEMDGGNGSSYVRKDYHDHTPWTLDEIVGYVELPKRKN